MLQVYALARIAGRERYDVVMSVGPGMNAWRARLPELFERVVSATPQERPGILAELRALDDDVAAEVERLVAASEREGTVLDRPAWAELDTESAVPSRIGPYHVVA